jgi:hypothetical protein
MLVSNSEIAMRNVCWWLPPSLHGAWRLCLVVTITSVILAGGFTPVLAQQVDEKEHREQVMPPPPRTEREQIPMVRPVPPPEIMALIRCAVRTVKCLAWTLLLVHILLAVWVYTDIRKRGEGNGIFIVLVLLAGIPAAILYALVRIGDRKT